MEAEIGNAAGTIWRYLEPRGQTPLGRLKQGTRLSVQLLFMGLGWLAREGKLDFAKDKRGFRVSLRER
jgi:hypothetical protein